jgi:hypothetical protein
MSKILIIGAILVAVLVAGNALYYYIDNEGITSFEECAAAGYPVGESYPRQCWTPNGKHFVENCMGFIQRHIDYLNDNPKGYWFKAKLYGWGWTPARWQGWVVLAVYVIAVAFFALTIDDNSPVREVMFTFILPVSLLTLLLLRICYKKGERPHWQWGPPDKKN